MYIVPRLTVPGGKPVTDVPGLTPTSPTKTPGPVLVNVELAKPTKLAAERKLGATAPGLAMTSGEGPPNATRSVVKMNKIVKYLSFCMV
jgi:hypothetical protein